MDDIGDEPSELVGTMNGIFGAGFRGASSSFSAAITMDAVVNADDYRRCSFEASLRNVKSQ